MKTKMNEYPLFSQWVWRAYDGKKSRDLDEFVKLNSDAQFYIGTDSQQHGAKCTFTTVLIAYRMGKGGAIILHSDKTPRYPALRQRLLMEAMRSLELAWYLDRKISADTFMAIHLDVNDNLKWKSGKYKDELVGMVMGQGFVSGRDKTSLSNRRVYWKPDAWAANSVADRKT